MNKPIAKKELKTDLKQEIMDAARNLFLKEGYEATSMRKIAAAVGVSATAIYLYYKDKAEIMHSLHQEGFKILVNRFRTLHSVAEPFERLKAMGRVYIDFALNNKDYYEIMFVMKEPLKHITNKDEQGEWVEGEATFQELINTIEDCQHSGYFASYNSHLLALLIWSNMHGLCTLENDGRLSLLTEKWGGHLEKGQAIHGSFEMYADFLSKI